MPKRSYLAIFFLLCMTSLNVSGHIRDSVSFYLKNSKPALIGGLTSRNTFIGSTKTSVTGVSGGYDFGGKFWLQVGAYWLSHPVESKKVVNAFTPNEYMVNERSTFWYMGLTSNYVFYRHHKWRLDIPLRIGMGSATTKQFELPPGTTVLNKNIHPIFPVESGINALYKLTWWVGFSGGIGSRVVLGPHSQKFSGTYYTLGVTVFFGDIYTRITKDMENPPHKRISL